MKICASMMYFFRDFRKQPYTLALWGLLCDYSTPVAFCIWMGEQQGWLYALSYQTRILTKKSWINSKQHQQQNKKGTNTNKITPKFLLANHTMGHLENLLSGHPKPLKPFFSLTDKKKNTLGWEGETPQPVTQYKIHSNTIASLRGAPELLQAVPVSTGLYVPRKSRSSSLSISFWSRFRIIHSFLSPGSRPHPTTLYL